MKKHLAYDLGLVARDLVAIAFLVRAYLALSAMAGGDTIRLDSTVGIAIELFCGSMLVLGWQVSAVSLALASLTLMKVTDALDTQDPEAMAHLLKDLAMAGGLLQIAATAKPLSGVDAGEADRSPSCANAAEKCRAGTAACN